MFLKELVCPDSAGGLTTYGSTSPAPASRRRRRTLPGKSGATGGDGISVWGQLRRGEPLCHLRHAPDLHPGRAECYGGASPRRPLPSDGRGLARLPEGARPRHPVCVPHGSGPQSGTAPAALRSPAAAPGSLRHGADGWRWLGHSPSRPAQPPTRPGRPRRIRLGRRGAAPFPSRRGDHLRIARARLHPASILRRLPARHVRRARREDSLPPSAGRERGRAHAGVGVRGGRQRSREPLHGGVPPELLGLQPDRLLRPPRLLCLPNGRWRAAPRVQGDGQALACRWHRGRPGRRFEPHRGGERAGADVCVPRPRQYDLLPGRSRHGRLPRLHRHR
jgi:hypothetical protein